MVQTPPFCQPQLGACTGAVFDAHPLRFELLKHKPLSQHTGTTRARGLARTGTHTGSPEYTFLSHPVSFPFPFSLQHPLFSSLFTRGNHQIFWALSRTTLHSQSPNHERAARLGPALSSDLPACIPAIGKGIHTFLFLEHAGWQVYSSDLPACIPAIGKVIHTFFWSNGAFARCVAERGACA